MYAGFLSGFWSRGIEMRFNVLLGGQCYIIFLRAKHVTTRGARNNAPLCEAQSGCVAC